MKKDEILPVLRLKALSKQRPEAHALLVKVQEQCGILLENSTEVPEILINRYNRLVMASDLPLPIRKDLKM